MSMGNAEDLLNASSATLDARTIAGGYVHDLRTSELEAGNQRPKNWELKQKMCSLSRGDIQTPDAKQWTRESVAYVSEYVCTTMYQEEDEDEDGDRGSAEQ